MRKVKLNRGMNNVEGKEKQNEGGTQKGKGKARKQR